MTKPFDPEGDPSDELLYRAIGDLDLSQLWAAGTANQYPFISGDEIADADDFDPVKGSLLRMASAALNEARQNAEGDIARLPEHHNSGWSLTIDTPEGPVGLWSSWLESRFYLGFPKGLHHLVPDELVAQTLGVERAVPVITDDGYNENGKRLWAKFYGPRLPEGGRVWVDYSDSEAYGIPFPQIMSNGSPREIYYGYDESTGISTFPFGVHSADAPDGPTDEPSAIQEYKEKFILLASRVAECLGGAQRMHINYGRLVMVPENLEREGYSTTWLQGTPGVREGWGNEIVVGFGRGEIVTLKSGNSMVPWSTIRRMDVPVESRQPEKLAQFILEDVLYF